MQRKKNEQINKHIERKAKQDKIEQGKQNQN